MSRSFGGLFDTSLPEIRISPRSTSSRPANIRNAVDFPDPDGPTRTMNSPSATSRSSAFTAGIGLPGKMRDAPTYCTSAMTLLPPSGCGHSPTGLPAGQPGETPRRQMYAALAEVQPPAGGPDVLRLGDPGGGQQSPVDGL